MTSVETSLHLSVTDYFYRTPASAFSLRRRRMPSAVCLFCGRPLFLRHPRSIILNLYPWESLFSVCICVLSGRGRGPVSIFSLHLPDLSTKVWALCTVTKFYSFRGRQVVPVSIRLVRSVKVNEVSISMAGTCIDCANTGICSYESMNITQC